MDTIVYVGIAGIVIALVEVLKVFLTGRMDAAMQTKILPLFVLGISMLVYVFVSMMYPPFDFTAAIQGGFILGIMSSGIYGFVQDARSYTTEIEMLQTIS